MRAERKNVKLKTRVVGFDVNAGALDLGSRSRSIS